jgi:hypothetical protein
VECVDSKEGMSTEAGWQNASKHYHLRGDTDRQTPQYRSIERNKTNKGEHDRENKDSEGRDVC